MKNESLTTVEKINLLETLPPLRLVDVRASHADAPKLPTRTQPGDTWLLRVRVPDVADEDSLRAFDWALAQAEMATASKAVKA